MYKLIKNFYPLIIILLPVISCFIYEPIITGTITNIIPVLLLPFFYKNASIRPFYFILIPLLLATRTPDSAFNFSYELITVFLFINILLKKTLFRKKENFNIPKIFFIVFLIFIFQLIVSLWTAASGETLFSLKTFMNYSFSFIYLIVFIYYCLNRVRNLDTIIYAFGFAGPLAGLIAIGYRITGRNMLAYSFGMENYNPLVNYIEKGIFHYASLLRYTYTNVHLIVLISIFAWFLIIKKYNILNIYNKLNLSNKFDIFYKFMFIFSILILFLFTAKSSIAAFTITGFLYCLYFILANLLNSPLKIKTKSIKLFLFSSFFAGFIYIGINFLLKIEAVLGDLTGSARLIVLKNLISYWGRDLYTNLSFLFGKGLFLDFSTLNEFKNIVGTEGAIDSFWLGFTFKAGLITTLIIIFSILKEILPSIQRMGLEFKIPTILVLMAISLSLIPSALGDSKVLWILVSFLAYIAKNPNINFKT